MPRRASSLPCSAPRSSPWAWPSPPAGESTGERRLLLRNGAHDLSHQRLARQLLVAHRGVINKRGHDDRGLLHVFFLNAVKNVHIRVVRARVVFQLILNELKAG